MCKWIEVRKSPQRPGNGTPRRLVWTPCKWGDSPVPPRAKPGGTGWSPGGWRGTGASRDGGLGLATVVCVHGAGTSGMGPAPARSLALPPTCQVAPTVSLTLAQPVSPHGSSRLWGGLGARGKGQPHAGWARETPAFRCLGERNH